MTEQRRNQPLGPLKSIVAYTVHGFSWLRPVKTVQKIATYLVTKPSIKRTLLKSLSSSYFSHVFVFPRIPLSPVPSGKHALVVLPFYDFCGSSQVSNTICAALKEEGYTVHMLQYNTSQSPSHLPLWDHSYFLKVQSGRFHKPRSFVQTQSANATTEGIDLIDEWAGDELALFTAALGRVFQFEICICNYVFLSRCLDYLPDTTLRVIYTHDVFANRNARITQAGASNTGWSFSTTEAEEAKGLHRAERVVAIQHEDAAYFATIVGAEKVDILTYVPERRYLPPRAASTPFIIGYIGSGHYPNVDAIRGFIAEFDFSTGTILRLAGGVCWALSKLKLPKQVELLGEINDLGSFYASCDLFINPDMLQSGMKIKCVEALSFGKPLICTKAASTGIGMNADYHVALTIADVARYAARATKDTKFLNCVTDESRNVFELFQKRYSTRAIINKYATLARNKQNNNNALALTP